MEIVHVEVTSVPERAGIWIDGVYEGLTPLVASVEWREGDGAKHVRIWRGGYRIARWELKRKEKRVSVHLAEVMEERPVLLKIEPAGAAVEVDGRPVDAGSGKIPLQWSVTRRRYTLTITHPGCEAREVDVTRESTLRPLEIRLTPKR